MKVRFWGVRGSTPCPCEANRRYGANTACVTLEVPGEDPIILDLGTGLRFFGETQPTDGSFQGSALVTHIHWDHVQGLPFFPPADRVGAGLDIYGPAQEGGPLGEVFGDFMRPPYFPVHFSQLRGAISFHDVWEDDLAIGHAKVRIRPVPHCGPTVGFRVDWGGATVAYISDHQAPLSLDRVADSVLELADGVDLLIHDAQYTRDEFAERSQWGHCTVDYAVLVAKEAGARRLALYHHDPGHDDEQVDRLVEEAAELGRAAGIEEVVGAAEGLTMALAQEA